MGTLAYELYVEYYPAGSITACDDFVDKVED
jgi:hypothetical protein